MSQYVRLTDVSPRDGLQNERGIVPTEEKVELIRLLAAAGVDEIEATSFVSPRWIPQLADAEEVLGELKSSPLHRPPPALSVLVPNRKGYERALGIHEPDFPLKIAVFTAASETFSKKNTNATVEETIERFREFVPEAIEHGMLVRCYISCAIGCPYEGDIDPRRVRTVADSLRGLAPDPCWEKGQIELDLGDTNGVGDSVRTRRLLEAFEPEERRRLTLHFHDTFGRAGECVREALGMGVLSFDGAVAGLGGCPYAGTEDEPAPGNVSTERVALVAEAEGFDIGVDIEKLRKAGERARQISHEATVRAAEAGA
jgi:hydroxymethylglutaryl-CoA lyase